jgi:hypothetical protein
MKRCRRAQYWLRSRNRTDTPRAAGARALDFEKCTMVVDSAERANMYSTLPMRGIATELPAFGSLLRWGDLRESAL